MLELYIVALMLWMMITGCAQPVVTSSYNIVEQTEYMYSVHKAQTNSLACKAKENPSGTHVMDPNDDEARQINRSCQDAVGVLGRINVPPHGDRTWTMCPNGESRAST